jgi:hypothetical protein
MTTFSSGSEMIIILCLVPKSDEGDDKTDSGHPQAHIEDHICISTRLCTKLLSCFCFIYRKQDEVARDFVCVVQVGLIMCLLRPRDISCFNLTVLYLSRVDSDLGQF